MDSSDLEQAPLPAVHDVRLRLKELERRDWWLWLTSIAVLLLLCFAVFSFSLPALLQLQRQEPVRQEQLVWAMKGLFALVLLFAVFALYQQYQAKRLRARLQAKMMALSELHARAETFERLCILDPLTGLFNRRFAVEYLPHEIARCDRTEQSLTILMIEIDDWDTISRRLGPEAAGDALEGFARHIKKVIRSADIPVRIGEDAFMIVLSECPLGNISRPVERMKGFVCTHRDQTIAIDFTIGCVEHKRGETASELLERADAALYQHKRDTQDV